MKEYHIFISGLVQGVGFRALVKRYALQQGINGFVRNLADGSVEICAQGEEGSVQALLQKIQTNPGRAVIHRVQVREEKIDIIYQSFEIFLQ